MGFQTRPAEPALLLPIIRSLVAAERARKARFVLRAATLLSLPAAVVLAPTAIAESSRAPRPPVVWKPIPMPATRLEQMAAYSERHYGDRTWRLVRPRVIVQHYTANRSYSATRATFAANSPDPELREKPGTCAHFIIDRDGTIYQLGRLAIRCRHTVGLNWTAIGIEHVGMSDGEILGNRRQLASSIALSRWLMGRYRIELGDVIGHAESLESPYRRERYLRWRCQTHGDFARAAMTYYRARLARAARAAGVPLGRTLHRVRSNCP
jgi:N-acetylmuramoyl-L-alanine amidase